MPDARLQTAGIALTPEQEEIIDKVEKLMRTAGRGGPEAEMYVSKAQELLTAYNLDMETVEANSSEGQGKRVDERLKGGHMQFQRDLWEAVAKLNFCLYWSQISEVRSRKLVPNKTYTGFVPQFKITRQREHRVVGRLVNARLTRVMSEYLEDAIERALREAVACGTDDSQLRGQWATSFKEGAAADIVERLHQRRIDLADEQRRNAAKARKAEHTATVAGETSSRAMTIFTLTEQEKDANWDFLYGEGYSAELKAIAAAAQQARAQRRAEADALWLKYKAEHPKEAAREEEKARKAAEKRAMKDRAWARRESTRANKSYKGDSYAYAAGARAGAKISIDQQAEETKTAGALK